MLQFLLPIAKALTLNGVTAKAIESATKALGKSSAHPVIQEQVLNAVVKKMDSPWWLSKRVRAVIIGIAIIICNDIFKLGITQESIMMINGLLGSYVGFKSIEQMKK